MQWDLPTHVPPQVVTRGMLPLILVITYSPHKYYSLNILSFIHLLEGLPGQGEPDVDKTLLPPKFNTGQNGQKWWQPDSPWSTSPVPCPLQIHEGSTKSNTATAPLGNNCQDFVKIICREKEPTTSWGSSIHCQTVRTVTEALLDLEWGNCFSVIYTVWIRYLKVLWCLPLKSSCKLNIRSSKYSSLHLTFRTSTVLSALL